MFTYYLIPIFQNISYPTDHQDFRVRVEQYLSNTFPVYATSFQLTEQKTKYLKQYDQFIFDLQLVADNHEMYDLHRAMYKTEEILHAISEEMISKRLLPQSNILEKKLQKEHTLCVRIEKDIQRLRYLQLWKERIMYSKAKAFKILSYLVSIIDILISVALIVFVSQIAHIGDRLFETVWGIIGFVAAVALVKVVLDRFRIIPTIDRIGRKRYRKRIAELVDLSSKLVGLVFLMSWMNDEDYPAREVLEVLEKGIVGFE